MIWEYLREEEFDAAVEASKGVCVVPVGCIEKHGQHLPLGTDVLHSTAIVRQAAEKEPVCVFPTMYFGEKTGAGEFKGTVIFSPELRLQILKETCREIHRNGFKKILLYSGHGGNSAMLDFFARSVLYEKNEYMVYTYALGADFASPKKLLKGNYPYLTEEDRKVLEDFVAGSKRCGHACFTETGWMYGTHPELVRLDKMDAESGESTQRFKGFAEKKIGTPFAWMANFPNSYDGSLHYGMNERIARAMVEYSVDRAVEVFAFLKNETVSDQYLMEWLEKQG